MALTSSDTDMRLRYLESEKGNVLTPVISGSNETYNVAKDYDGSAVSTGASLSTVRSACVSVDPSITSAS